MEDILYYLLYDIRLSKHFLVERQSVGGYLCRGKPESRLELS